LANAEGDPGSSRFSIEEIKRLLKRFYKTIFEKIPEVDDFQVENVELGDTGPGFTMYGNISDVHAHFMGRKFHITTVRVDLVMGSASPVPKLLDLDTERYEFKEEFKLSLSEMEKIESGFIKLLERRVRERLSDIYREVRSRS